MNFTKILVVLLAVVCCTLLAPTDAVGHHHSHRTPQAHARSLCKTTTDPLLCYNTILPKALTGKLNMYEALGIQIAVTKAQVDKTAAHISALIATPGNYSVYIANCLDGCKGCFASITNAIAETGPLLAKRDLYEAKFKFNSVLANLQACEAQFEGETSPIAADAQAVYALSANSLDIIVTLEDREKRRRQAANPVTVPSVGGGPCQGVNGTCG